MGSRRDLIVLVGVLILLAAIAIAVRPGGSGGSDDPRVSSFLTGPNGAAALYMLMQELDIPSRRLLRDWSADSSSGAIVLLAPSQPATPQGMRALRTWIEGGGTLLYGAGGAGGEAGIDDMLGLELRRTLPDTLGALATVRWEGVAAFPVGHPWTEGVDSVAGFGRVFHDRSRALNAGSTALLLRTAEGAAAAVTFTMGAGRVIAWSDASVLTNGNLRGGGSAVLFARAAEAVTADGAALRFDEYHHGYREAKPLQALMAVLTGTGGGRALLQGVVACLALLLLAGARFGAPAEEHTERRRSPIEHMQALAGAYERSDARGAARRLLLAGMERRLGRRVVGDDAVLPPAALDGTAAGRRLKKEWERGAGGDLTDLATAIDDFVTEVRRWK